MAENPKLKILREKAMKLPLTPGVYIMKSSDAEIIYAHLPDKSGLGLALYNRMIRAAAHTVLKIDKDDFMKGV